MTVTQQRIYDLLKDGLPHTKEELRFHLNDTEMENHTISVHIANIRKIIGRQGLSIIYRPPFYYQIVRLLHSAYDGRR